MPHTTSSPNHDVLCHLAISAPAFLVEEILTSESPWKKRFAQLLRSGEWKLPLSEGTRAFDLFRAETGRDPERQASHGPGVLCLCAEDVPWSLEPGKKFGTVRWLGVKQGPPANATSFERSCTAGTCAALAWLQDKVKLGYVPPCWKFEPIPLLGRRGCDPEPEGGSAGLAAALALVRQFLANAGIEDRRVLAATGVVNSWGGVERVGYLPEKLDGILREMPVVDTVFIPKTNAAEIDPARFPFDIEQVDSVEQALERLWPKVDFGRVLSQWSPVEAAGEAFALEIRQNHAQARLLAEQALEALQGREAESRDFRLASVRAHAVAAINWTHRGATHKALAELQRVDELSIGMPLPLETRAVVAAVRAGALLDNLEHRQALDACDEKAIAADDLETQTAILVLGTLLRCQTAQGLLEPAESTWRLYFESQRGRIDDLPRMWCYRIELLVKRVAAGDAGALDAARRALDVGRESNLRILSVHEQKENSRYLDLAECRMCAVAGEADRAVQLAGALPVQATGGWPDHHRHRLAAEALARAKRFEDAVERAGRAWRTIHPESGAFVRLVLMTAAAIEAILRIKNGQTGWQVAALAFADATDSYKEGWLQRPAEAEDADGWLKCLRKALDDIPY